MGRGTLALGEKVGTYQPEKVTKTSIVKRSGGRVDSLMCPHRGTLLYTYEHRSKQDGDRCNKLYPLK